MQSVRFLFLFLSICILISLAIGQTSDLANVLDKYRHSKSVISNIVKEVNLSLLEQTQVSQGKFYFSKGRLRIEFNEPDNTLLVINGKNIWIEKRLPKEFSGPAQVIQITAGKDKKKLQGPLSILLGHKKALSDFKVTKKVSGRRLIFQLIPKDKKEYANLVNIEIAVEKASLKSFSYWDDLENKTSYRFSQTVFNREIPKSQFLYSPPKNAEITRL